MFLREIKSNKIPDLDLINHVDLNARLRYKQSIIEQLIKRFRREYLSQLIMKSNKPKPRALKEGNIVLIGDDSKKRFDWPMASAEKLISVRDNTPWVVSLKTKNGMLKRPIQRIYPLEINNEEDNTLSDNGEDFWEKMMKNELCFENRNEISSILKTKKLKKNNVKHSQTNEVLCSEMKTWSGRIIKKPLQYINLNIQTWCNT